MKIILLNSSCIDTSEEKRQELYSKALAHMEKKGCAGFDDVKSLK